MREVLFRGKAEKSKSWVQGSLIIYPDGACFICQHSENPDILNKYLVDDSTVGQFTGMFDKNKRRIFEGDIIGCFCGTQLFEAAWCDERGGYFLDNVVVSGMSEPSVELLANFLDTAEVIGNIYDNPELTEE